MSPFPRELSVHLPTIVKYSGVVSAPWMGPALNKTEHLSLSACLRSLLPLIPLALSFHSASLHFSRAEAPMDPLAPLPLLSSVSWSTPRTL